MIIFDSMSSLYATHSCVFTSTELIVKIDEKKRWFVGFPLILDISIWKCEKIQREKKHVKMKRKKWRKVCSIASKMQILWNMDHTSATQVVSLNWYTIFNIHIFIPFHKQSVDRSSIYCCHHFIQFTNLFTWFQILFFLTCRIELP